jgi:uncharacterized membrane protein
LGSIYPCCCCYFFLPDQLYSHRSRLSRYLPENTSKFQVWRFTYLGMLAVTIWLEILGALTASLGTQTGPMEFFSTLMGVFMIPALLTIILSIFPINAVAMYSGGLAMQAMGIPIKRWLSAVVIGGTAMPMGNRLRSPALIASDIIKECWFKSYGLRDVYSFNRLLSALMEIKVSFTLPEIISD